MHASVPSVGSQRQNLPRLLSIQNKKEGEWVMIIPLIPLLFLTALRAYKICIPVATVFDNATLCWIVNVDDAKAFAITIDPLKVVQKRPDEVAAQRNSALE